MARILYLALVFALLITSVVMASSSYDSYCVDLFQNKAHAVSSVFSGSGNPSTSLLTISLAVVALVLVLLSVVYGIGIGFGINKLVTFAKSEYLESFFNIFIILALVGGIAVVGGLSGLFSNISGLGIASTPSGSGGTAYNIYASICTQMIQNQFLPSIVQLFGLSLQQPFYTFAQSLTITTPATAWWLPQITISPLAGLTLYNEVTIFELSPLFAIVMLSIGVIFLFYVIYFLFPIFLFAGILLRSFPWTRAAGGTLIALFVAFYVVFPGLYLPFSAIQLQQQSTTPSQFCQNAVSASVALSGSSPFGPVPPLSCTPEGITGVFSDIFNRGWVFIQAVFGSLLTGGGGPFVSNLDLYAGLIASSVLRILGMGIAFLISFDLLEGLGDLLGSPSLQSGRILKRII